MALLLCALLRREGLLGPTMASDAIFQCLPDTLEMSVRGLAWRLETGRALCSPVLVIVQPELLGFEASALVQQALEKYAGSRGAVRQKVVCIGDRWGWVRP